MTEADLFGRIRALELRLLDRDVRSRREALEEHMDPDFLEFGSSGRIFEREEVIELLMSEAPRAFEIFDFAIRRLAPDVVLATYRVKASAEGASSRESLRSSIWLHGASTWRIVFHQGTLLA